MESQNTPETIKYPLIAAELLRMTEVDQAMRTRTETEKNYWDESVDVRNTERMKEIIAEIGFPTISKVGKESSHNAWLLVQHADHDVKFQLSCLGLMKEFPAYEISRVDIAYLEDRTRVNQHQGQLYGTQFDQIDGKHIPEPIEDEENVDRRRLEMGMGTLTEQIAEMYEQYPFK